MVPFSTDLLDFTSDMGEEDNEEENPKRPLASLDPNGPELVLFDVLHLDDPSLLFPESCFMGHFLGVYLGLGEGECSGKKVTSLVVTQLDVVLDGRIFDGRERKLWKREEEEAEEAQCRSPELARVGRFHHCPCLGLARPTAWVLPDLFWR
jgi:hypothetical protein